MQYHYQTNNYECGPLALQNAFIALGMNDIDRKDIRTVSRTDRIKGTSEYGIIRAIKFYGLKHAAYKTKDARLAWRWAYKWSARTPCIVSVDEWDHWALLSGVISNRINLIDSIQSDRDLAGVYCLDKKELLDRWVGRGAYYAIRVMRG